ncbi:MAG: LytTR family DNA-binding domain-containing protein, partial [Bacteroidales bacterium]|nr:LytTR family DNA-binding domain-containing protein [Bacteroidales bacterium]
MINSLIIDDEIQSRDSLKSYLNLYCPEVKLLDEADNVETGIKKIEKYNPELVFLDVQMPDGTGFDLLERIHKRNFNIIFVTAYDKYAIKAFKFSAIDFLLKPVDSDELINAVKKLDLAHEVRLLNKKIELLLQNKEGFKKIAIPSMNEIEFVQLSDIIRCESDANYTIFYLKDGHKKSVSRTLKEFDEMLSNEGFCRVHHSQLVNLSHVLKYIKGEGGQLVLDNDD